MEIALLAKNTLRIKGKKAVFAVDGFDKTPSDAVLFLNQPSEAASKEDTVVIVGPGEFEIGGAKITGTRGEADMLYGLTIDGVDMLLGKLQALDAMQHKLKEYNVVAVLCDAPGNASFVTALASNAIIFYGEKAGEVVESFGKENVKSMSKYSVTKDKLPVEVETVVLA